VRHFQKPDTKGYLGIDRTDDTALEGICGGGFGLVELTVREHAKAWTPTQKSVDSNAEN